MTAVSRPCCCLPNYIFMLFRDSYSDACPQESIPSTNISTVLFWRIERVNSRTLHQSVFWTKYFRVHGIALHCTYMKYILTAPVIRSCAHSAPQIFSPCWTATRDSATRNTSYSRVHTKLATQRNTCTNIHRIFFFILRRMGKIKL